MKSSVQITSAVVLVGVIVWLFIRIEGYKDAKSDQARELHRLEWLLSAKEAETDSIKNIGRYSKIDKISVKKPLKIVYRDSLHVDTVYGDTPEISEKFPGKISIDTTKEYGPESNRLSVHVSGRFYYPEEYSYRNWLLIVPSFKEAPYVPVTPRPKSWSIGLNYSRAFSHGDYLGVAVRYKRFTVAPAYDPWHKIALMTVGFDILSF